MKKVFDKAGVSNSPWRIISGKPGSIRGICQRVGKPLLLKPAVSGGSMGVSVKNVVHSEQELKTRLEELAEGYRGWNLQADGLFVERFITGPEFTTFITDLPTTPLIARFILLLKDIFTPPYHPMSVFYPLIGFGKFTKRNHQCLETKIFMSTLRHQNRSEED